MTTYPPEDVVAATDKLHAGASGGYVCSEGCAPADALQPQDASQSQHPSQPRALVRAVTPLSPADDAGFEPGCYILAVDGHPVRDLIDWRWLTSEDVITVEYIDLDGDQGVVELEREEGEEWGFTFEGVVFDAIRQCRNACTFCFMRQLPGGMRPSLSLRDDDYRLSFLSGTFVTFTNLTPDDEKRIIEQHISPLRVSLHAVDARVRARMIGKHAAHGIEVLDRLLEAGITFHAQIVLVPGENDGDVLTETLEWAWQRPGIVDICIVPLGYTKHQHTFDESFNRAAAARAVINLVEPFQTRALAKRGHAWAHPADEFYRNAYQEQLLDYLPPRAYYGDFGMFEDGVGIIRTFVDDWTEADAAGSVRACAAALARENVHVHFVAGYAMREVIGPLLDNSDLRRVMTPLFVKNEFFGGNVDVTGLLCGCDIINAIQATCSRTAQNTAPLAAAPGTAALQSAAPPATAPLAAAPGTRHLFVLPRVMFNDDSVTLDDMSLQDMEKASGAWLAVVSCNASDFLTEIIAIVSR